MTDNPAHCAKMAKHYTREAARHARELAEKRVNGAPHEGSANALRLMRERAAEYAEKAGEEPRPQQGSLL